MKVVLLAAVFVVVTAGSRPAFAAAATPSERHEGACVSSLDEQCSSHFAVERDVPPGTPDAAVSLARIIWHHHHHDCTCGLSKNGSHAAGKAALVGSVFSAHERRLPSRPLPFSAAINRPRRQ